MPDRRPSLACPHPQTRFDERGVRVCAACGEVSVDQRPPLLIAQETAAKAGSDSLVGMLWQRVADNIARGRA